MTLGHQQDICLGLHQMFRGRGEIGQQNSLICQRRHGGVAGLSGKTSDLTMGQVLKKKKVAAKI